ncbi:hypothetical protein EDD65_101149 [Keratinibaculum paraultunense]|uniref:Uncharacterized protein n=1 Tax=Keratinibaculum paraultunense TaxID=1278232 RepID=A0A4R3KZA2_9FIRM|nr:hypothetical protein [Keratinibaculum paraultunense]QQY80033.1 hypothetical protein JL105_01480 [Keratinibaculum paraultunense]TCS91646.1 hypothetical protein EDD65_101149 [Keratinibaculum paraultunense]
MYNSVVVNLFMNIWDFLERCYIYSNLKKFNNFIGNGIKKLSKGSNLIKLFTSSRSLIKESFFYRIYSNIIGGINNLFTELRKRIEKNNDKSIIYNFFNSLLKDNIHLVVNLCVFFLSFGIGIIINNIIRGFYVGRSYIMALIFIFVSIVILSIRDYKSILKESYFCSFIRSIFTIDEGVDQWW